MTNNFSLIETFAEEMSDQWFENSRALPRGLANQWVALANLAAGSLRDCAELRQEMRDLCDKMARMIFGIPGMPDPIPPPAWAEHPVGRLWHQAMIWALRDELVTIKEAAHLAGVSTQAIANRIAAGKLQAFVDDTAPAQQRRRLVRRADVVKSEA